MRVLHAVCTEHRLPGLKHGGNTVIWLTLAAGAKINFAYLSASALGSGRHTGHNLFMLGRYL